VAMVASSIQAVPPVAVDMLHDVGAGHTPGGRVHGSTQATAAAGACSCQWNYQLSIHSIDGHQTGESGRQPQGADLSCNIDQLTFWLVWACSYQTI
jgi:hypothetical protein